VSRVFTGYRNMAGHPSYGCQPPAEPARQISDVAEFINRLWGEQVPAGRLFPVPGLVHRIPFAVVRDTESGITSIGAAERFLDWDDVTSTAEVSLVLASADDDLSNFRHGFESTRLPCTPIWGPGKPEDAAAYLALNAIPNDHVAYVIGSSLSGRAEISWPRSAHSIGP